MQAGRKPLSDSVKKERGTLQKCRSRDEIKVPDHAPVMPAYLTPAAKKIWKEELPRVLATKVTDTDSSLFARYCALEALVREQFAAGEIPKAAYMTELRRIGECLGLTGPSSRVSRAEKQTESNPFSVLLGPKPSNTN